MSDVEAWTGEFDLKENSFLVGIFYWHTVIGYAWFYVFDKTDKKKVALSAASTLKLRPI